MTKGKESVRRCAIYTRKSSEEGLEQDFNSLHAQREACEAFIKSQRSEGWRLIETAYDDGGLSGGTMERPALQRLLNNIRAGLVDIVVVYKVDRLTRSLADFAKMVELFDAHDVSFVSVTQQFNTTTSMGRLTLNILLSFAQFEREVTGERIRDKIAASKKKGMWMGGNVPLGYDVQDRKLIINRAEAESVRDIYRGYLELSCVRRLKEDLDRRGVRSKTRMRPDGTRHGGLPFSRGALYALLANPIYVGEIRHKGARHVGQHEAIIDRDVWEAVQAHLVGNAPDRRELVGKSDPSPLAGRLFDEAGERLTPSHAVKRGRRYRYYVSRAFFDGTAEQAERGWRLSAQEIEHVVAAAAVSILQDPAAIAGALREAEVPVGDVSPALARAAELSRRLASDTERACMIVELVERVELQQSGMCLTIKLASLTTDGFKANASALPMITRAIPLQMKRRGVETRLVIEGAGSPSPNVDQALIKAVARAHQWFADLVSGRAASITEIASRDGVASQYVGNLLPLAFLASDIVDAIVAGRQPIDLTAKTLIHRIDLPLDWMAQKKMLGFA
jgi:DNA invertase Pin-like site-specific DNA recombinase